jgi:hypothetical protein
MRKTTLKLILGLVLATAGVMPVATQADESAGTGPDNVVWVKTTGANARDQQSNLAVGIYDGKELRSTNVARADSTDCTDCRTVAVAVQAVFATGKPTTVAPTNAAIALNERCLRCTTYAYAYQYVVTTDKPIHMDRGSKRKLDALRREIDDVAQSDLPPQEMDARLNTLTNEFKTGIDDYLRKVGERPGGRVKEDEQEGPQQ